MDTQTIIIRLLVAAALGGLIGAEREYRDKSAGFRTMMLISLGAALFTLVSTMIGTEHTSDDRIASNIVTGIGFVGAGVIFKDVNHVNGITTAAAIWIVAAIGMAAGNGNFITAVATCVITLVVLIIFYFVEQRLDDSHKVHHYEVAMHYEEGIYQNFEKIFLANGLTPTLKSLKRNNRIITCHWILHGGSKNHEKLMRELMSDDKVYECNFYQ